MAYSETQISENNENLIVKKQRYEKVIFSRKFTEKMAVDETQILGAEGGGLRPLP